MENLAKGFVYLIALGWVGTEVLMLASHGLAWPLAAVLLLFVVGFVVVGCYPLEDQTVEKAGRLFFSFFALACLFFALRTLSMAPFGGTLKTICAVALCVIALRPPAARESHGH